ncbi:hypothetical protein [Variovorax saccharolyticus]|uniref:hypothetical protein n=1 Tax=Variovorax saccharolyticus TaxID=3053516 RepID=UPI0025768633|nr:hypothetical protein [Variovorax sp. J31P216]MDM0025729.1 hypothetical protein [Variovorax sp. J31P216]
MANESFYLRSRLLREAILSGPAQWFDNDLSARNAARRLGHVVVRAKADKPVEGRKGELCVVAPQDAERMIGLGLADTMSDLPLMARCANCGRQDRYEDVSGLPSRRTDRSLLHEDMHPELSDAWIECASCQHFTHFAVHASRVEDVCDRQYLQSLVDGTGDFWSPEVFERLQPMFARYESDQTMLALLERAAAELGDVVAATAQTLMDDLDQGIGTTLRPVVVIPT